jgi:flagellar biogenesis protein FliO
MVSAPRIRLQAGVKGWLLLGLIGLAALGAGIAVPQLLPASSVRAETNTPHEPAPKQSPDVANNLNYTPPSWPDTPDPRSLLTRVAVGTVVVLGLCVGTLLVLKRCTGAGAVKNSGGKQLRVVESLSLGNRCALHLIAAGNRQVLAGVDSSGIKALVALPDSFENALNEVQADETSTSQAEAVPTGAI